MRPAFLLIVLTGLLMSCDDDTNETDAGEDAVGDTNTDASADGWRHVGG